MRGKRSRLMIIIVAGLLLIPSLIQAQQAGPLLIIHGRPDAKSNPPEVRTYVSVIDKENAQAVEGLSGDNFRVEEAGAAVEALEVSPEEIGMAVAIVVDRGGISAAGDSRIHEAADLARELVNRLSVAGATNDDVIAIVGVGQDGVLAPEENFSYNPVDTNLVLNALVLMEGETVRGGTPLYEGMDEALNLLTKNPDGAIREVLTHRRKVIVVFSDGVDPDFSDEAREQDILRKALAENISIYAMGMAKKGGKLTAEGNLKKLAAQTDGVYRLHNSDDSHQEVLALFDRLVTQRKQYVLSYATHQPKADYTLDVVVETDAGSADARQNFSSILELPKLYLSVSPDVLEHTLPYSATLRGSEWLTLTLSVRAESVDGVNRAPSVVRYYVNGDQVGESAAAPDFLFEWPVSELHQAGSEPITETYTLAAEAADPYLRRSYTTEAPVKIKVGWEKRPMEREIEEEVKQNWWQILVFAAMFLALAIVLLILLRTRSELAKKVVKGATGMLKGVTRPLSAASKQTPGKLVIQQGANIGREYRIGAQVVKVGRDPQFSDFALFDDFVSNPHFSIHMEGMQFYITDEGSTNGTRLNGIALPPHQRTPLAPDAVIEVGQIRLQFKQIGLATRPLEERAAGRPAGAGPPVPPVGTPSPGPYATRPVSETPAPSAQPSPYATRPVQETPASAAPSPYATRKVEDTPDEDVPPNPYATRKVKD